jgi:two-component system sensor histidine kinase UhpB
MIEATRILARFLSVGTFWKILLANALLVACAVMLVPDALHGLQPDLSSLGVLVVVTGATLLANAVLLRLALAPLTELERAAERVAGGDLQARARVSPLADRPLAELTRTFNRMVQSVEAQRQLGRDVASQAIADADEAKRRASRDLRDDSAQALTSALLRLRGIRSLQDPAARDQALEEVRVALAEVIDRLRSLAGQLSPSGLELLGVDQVIESYATAAVCGSGLRLTLARASLRGALAPEAELELLRVVEDVIDRAVVQAASVLRVGMAREEGHAVVTVQRDGSAPAFAEPGDRSLFALRERASYFGGTIEVSTTAGETRVEVRFPLNPIR